MLIFPNPSTISSILWTTGDIPGLGSVVAPPPPGSGSNRPHLRRNCRAVECPRGRALLIKCHRALHGRFTIHPLHRTRHIYIHNGAGQLRRPSGHLCLRDNAERPELFSRRMPGNAEIARVSGSIRSLFLGGLIARRGFISSDGTANLIEI